MKKTLTILALALILLLSILLVLLLTHGNKPAIQIIPDMATAAAHTGQAPPAGTVPFGPARKAQPAAVLYRHHCAVCHGNTGNGQSYVAAYEGMPAIGDLTTTTKTEPELIHSLLHGRGAMPAFRNRLNDAEASSLINHIFTHLQHQ
ncbi:MAG: cytochrome c [Akkermansia sp.]|nr:cytochrome c [Akkermansia sp.]